MKPYVKIFYAWQTDLPDETNRRLIRESLRTACSAIEDEFKSEHLRLELDEATRGESGSPNIPQSIQKKIEESDIFIADITTVNKPARKSKKTPNPNVVFELGYAVAHLGWSRVILLFNKAYGTFPDDMPFDFDRHRASPFEYRISKEVLSKKASAARKAPLTNLLCEAIRAVIVKKPKKPAEDRELAPEERKRARDIINLKWILATVHLPTLQQHLDDIPHRITDRALFFWEGFNGVYQSNLFYLYDEKAKTALAAVHREWHTTISFSEHYDTTFTGGSHIFHNRMDLPLDEEQQKDWDTIAAAARSLRKCADTLLEHVRENYLEIDLDELSASAWKGYVDFEKEAVASMEGKEKTRDKVPRRGRKFVRK